jgi:hypothetical protein
MYIQRCIHSSNDGGVIKTLIVFLKPSCLKLGTTPATTAITAMPESGYVLSRVAFKVTAGVYATLYKAAVFHLFYNLAVVLAEIIIHAFFFVRPAIPRGIRNIYFKFKRLIIAVLPTPEGPITMSKSKFLIWLVTSKAGL